MNQENIYHLTKPMTDDQATEFVSDLDKSFKMPVRMPLGGQSNGFFFFTTRDSINEHIEFLQDKNSLNTDSDKHLYLVQASVDMNDVKYPVWQLDYEASKDYFFDLILDRANVSDIKFDGIKISANNRILQIEQNKKLIKLREFAPEHSGLIEKIVGYLYYKEKTFKAIYDKTLAKVLSGQSENITNFAVKTTQCPKLLSCTKIENTIKPVRGNQLSKWYAKYGKAKGKE